jgi:Matrixin
MTVSSRPFSRPSAGILCAVLVLAAAHSARASIGPKWSEDQLASLSDVIVSGYVRELRSGWDPAVNTIYTYVTIDVDDVLKGAPSARITVKQLGGQAGEVGLAITDQPSFRVGEHVLVFLETRPRDHTLYTSALWQGKWSVANGLAIRQSPGGAEIDRLSVRNLRANLAALGADPDAATSVETDPPDRYQAQPQPFVLMTPPYRYSFSPPVSLQAGGQPGLPGGGFGEIATVIGRWNGAGSSFRFGLGGTNAAQCTTAQGNSDVRISVMDPCGEISNSGSTFAIAGSYYSTSGGTTVNGQFFLPALDGFVVNNDGPAALTYLTNNGCWSDIELHELGHVLGLYHTADPAATMFPIIDNSCFAGAHGLGSDDIAGIRFIYPSSGPGGTPPSSAPTNVQVVVNGTASLSISWTGVSADSEAMADAATTYRLDFRATIGGPILASFTVAQTAVVVPIPPGVVGTFNVVVTGLNAVGPGPTSAPTTFTIGGGGCVGPPPAPTGLVGGVIAGTATVTWNPSPGATSYVVQAGTIPLSSNLFNANVGNTTVVSASGLPPFFQAYVRVIAVNACGLSAPTADFLVR